MPRVCEIVVRTQTLQATQPVPLECTRVGTPSLDTVKPSRAASSLSQASCRRAHFSRSHVEWSGGLCRNGVLEECLVDCKSIQYRFKREANHQSNTPTRFSIEGYLAIDKAAGHVGWLAIDDVKTERFTC